MARSEHSNEIRGETIKVELTVNARVWADHCIEVERHRIEDGCPGYTPENFIARLLAKMLFQSKLENIVDEAVGVGSEEDKHERRARIIGMLMLSIMTKRPCTDPEINEIVSRVQEIVEDYGIDLLS